MMPCLVVEFPPKSISRVLELDLLSRLDSPLFNALLDARVQSPFLRAGDIKLLCKFGFFFPQVLALAILKLSLGSQRSGIYEAYHDKRELFFVAHGLGALAFQECNIIHVLLAKVRKYVT